MKETSTPPASASSDHLQVPAEGQATIFVLLWMATVAYVVGLLLSPPGWLPGEPVWAIRSETIREILNESLNFFFILPVLNLLGVSYLQAPVVDPVAQSFFNLAEAWIFMFLPLMLLDRRGQRLPKMMLWGLAMFLTNIFLMPYMALRLRLPADELPKNQTKGLLARFFGGLGLTVGNLAVVWFCFNRPDLGGVLSRFGELGEQITHNRVSLAFMVDMILFWVFQSWLMGAVIPREEKRRILRFIPFWGLAIWLLI